MGQQSTPIQTRFLSRQDNAPSNPVDGFIWINPNGGQNGNNVEQYNWNADAGDWELTDASGPDTPLHPAQGATWLDTSVSPAASKIYDGGWQNQSATFDTETGTSTNTSEFGGTFSVSFANTYRTASPSVGFVDTGDSATGADENNVVGFAGWTTNSDGDIDGMKIYRQFKSGYKLRWHVFGVVV